MRPVESISPWPAMVSPGVHLGEHAVALQIDDLLGLRDRKGNGVVPGVMHVGPNEPVVFRTVGEVLLDDPRSLVLPLRSVRGRPDAVALVFDLRRVRLVSLASRSPTGHAGPHSFEFRKHGPRPSLESTEITMPACSLMTQSGHPAMARKYGFA
jgi:hypothetical protein